MRLIDKIAIAYKNIKDEGSKSILTFFIVFVLSFLLISLLIVSTSFYVSINNSYEQLLVDDSININVNIIGNVSNLTYENMKKSFLEYEYVSEVKSSYGIVTLYDYDYLESIDNIDLKSVKGKNYVFLNSSYQDEYVIDDIFKTLYGELIVKGFFSNRDEKVIADMDYFQFSSTESYSILNIKCNFSGLTNYNQAINDSTKLMNELDDLFAYVGSNELDQINQIKNVSMIVLIVMIFMTFILLLLSVGTISNSIIISMDQNYYKTGLYKTMGMTDKDTFSISVIQVLITIIFSTLLSTLIVLCLQSLIKILTKSLFDFIVNMALNSDIEMLKFYFYFPWYIPLIMIVLLTLFSIVFAKTSINRIVKATPIEIINEVSHNEK